MDDYKWSVDGSLSNLSKYNASDRKTVLDPEDDAAHVNMGGNWRMPTLDEYNELCLNTDIYLVPNEGEEIKGTARKSVGNISLIILWDTAPSGENIKGVKFYKKSDKQTYIFVPAAGYAGRGSMQLVSQDGFLWSSSLVSSSVGYVWELYFRANIGYVDNTSRFYGVPVRGVIEQ